MKVISSERSEIIVVLELTLHDIYIINKALHSGVGMLTDKLDLSDIRNKVNSVYTEVYQKFEGTDDYTG